MPTPLVSRAIVARFANGEMLKGTTHDFAPDKALFHVYAQGDETQKAVPVPMASLKAVFFVRSYQGNKYHVEDKSFDGVAEQGRRARVVFKDGEVLAGFSQGSVTGRAGFFLLPADPRSNNLRMFIVHAAVATIQWPGRGEAAPGPAAAPTRPAAPDRPAVPARAVPGRRR